jgi:hypothetical protein
MPLVDVMKVSRRRDASCALGATVTARNTNYQQHESQLADTARRDVSTEAPSPNDCCNIPVSFIKENFDDPDFYRKRLLEL